jgi:hypothetical protein
MQKYAYSQEQCLSQTGANCTDSEILLPIPFDDNTADQGETIQEQEEEVEVERQADEREVAEESIANTNNNENPLVLPFP